MIGDFLGLRDLRELAVVEYEDDDAEPLCRCGGELEARHAEGAVADDSHDLCLRPRELRPDRGRHAVPHAVEVRR